MKIISRVPKEKVMVIMSEDELANILGHYSRYSEGFIKSIEAAIAAETEFDVKLFYQKYQLIAGLQKQSEYDKARATLQTMLRALTPVEDLLMKLPAK